MSKGITLIEFMIGLLLGSLIMVCVCSLYVATAWTYSSQKTDWLCMQSLRAAVQQIDRDVVQCGFLLPDDLKVICENDRIFFAGLPPSSDHDGLKIHQTLPPPYFSIVSSKYGNSIITDTLDIDSDGRSDFKANYGIITDSGAFQIMSHYSRGNSLIPLSEGAPNVGDRIIPAVVYQVKGDGLYRNSQLLSENIDSLSASISGNEINITMKVNRNDITKEITYGYIIR